LLDDRGARRRQKAASVERSAGRLSRAVWLRPRSITSSLSDAPCAASCASHVLYSDSAFVLARFFAQGVLSLGAAAHSELHDCEAGDHLEVANIGCRDAVAEFKCRYTDQQISQWQPHSSGLILAVEFSGANRQRRGNQINR
jgi:hypothetical protein